MIIDAHCHAGAGDGLTGPWDTAAPLDRYLVRAARAGIQRTILFAPFHSSYDLANGQVAQLVAARPGRLLGFAFVNAARDRGRVRAMVHRMVGGHEFRGIKVHRHDARLSREICETARALALPVLYDLMGEVSSIELFAREYPDVAFVIPHLGSFADDWGAQLAFIDHLRRHPNVYTDSSGVRRFDLLARAVHEAGPHKVIFGTDGPFLHPAVELAKIRALRLPPRDEALVLGGNILRLMPPRGLTRPSALGASAALGR
jgi:predicted TIM-barrel fold metal-dependent hydrolase